MSDELRDQDTSEGFTLGIEQTRELEERISQQEVSLEELMERAGAALAETVKQAVPSPARIAVFAGSGNNGGDGWVAAELLAREGYDITFITRRAASDIKAEPAHAAAMRAQAAFDETETVHVFVNPEMEQVKGLLQESEIVVDAILGIGFDASGLRAPFDAWIAAINEARENGAAVIAADVPSGMSAETGKVASPCVKANCTVCMIVFKNGLLEKRAKPYVGQLKLATLGIDVSKYISSKS